MHAHGMLIAALTTLLCACQGAPDLRQPQASDSLSTADDAPPLSTRSFEPAPNLPIIPEPEPADYGGMLEAHNLWRAEVQSPGLSWSSRAAAIAQAWADQLQSEGCAIRHNTAPERKHTYGENIYRYWRSSPYDGYRRDVRFVADAWGAEKPYYDATSNSCAAPPGGMCGHYTQLVWSRSLQVGCGRAHCADSEVWVCNYYPRGNYVGVRPFDLAANAAPATSVSEPAPEAPAEVKDLHPE